MSVVEGGAHSLALTTDGILWVWGSNGNGELGIGQTRFKSICSISSSGKTIFLWPNYYAGGFASPGYEH